MNTPDTHTDPYMDVKLGYYNGKWMMCDVIQLTNKGYMRHEETDDLTQYVKGHVKVQLIIECSCLWFMYNTCGAHWTVRKMEYKKMS